MTEDEIKAIDQRLAAMSERVDRVIEKESRGKPMPVLDFKLRPKAKYVPLPEPYHEELLMDGSIEQIFADFERQFDEMAQAHRGRA